MTANQIIVLMDVMRGFRGDIHTGTLRSDLECLERVGLIHKSNEPGDFEWVLTVAGEAVCGEMVDRFTDTLYRYMGEFVQSTEWR